MRHIFLTCTNHPTLRWHCKSVAVGPSHDRPGTWTYNGMRHIFFEGGVTVDGDTILVPECDCPSAYLTLAPGETPPEG